MDEYFTLFCIAYDKDNEITDVIKSIDTTVLKELDKQLKKEFQEKNFFCVGLTKEEELIGIQLTSQYLTLISLIGLELLEREK